MTDIIGEAAYRIRADTSGFQSEAESGLLPAIKRIGGVLAAAFVAKKIFDFGKEAVTEAAKTQKAVESVRASFGRFGGDIVHFNENMASTFGVSNAQASAFSSQLGTLTDNLGISNLESAAMTENLEKLGANMASIKGIDPAEVFSALGSSLAGSTRGLKQFGIVIGTADIAQRAFKLGLIDTVDDALTPAAKAQAIYSLEMDHFGEIAKRAGKNQDDLSNVTQRLGAEFDNIKEKIGTFLLPLIAQVGLVIEKQVIPFVTEWVDILQAKLGPAVDSIGGFLKAHADTILSVAKAFVVASTATIGLGSAIETLSLSMELLTSPIGIILALGTALVLAYQNVQVFHDAVDSLVSFLGGAFGGAISAVKDAVDTISQAFAAAGRHKKFSVQANIIWQGVKTAADDLWTQISDAFTGDANKRQPIKIGGPKLQFDMPLAKAPDPLAAAGPGFRERFETWFGDLHKLDITQQVGMLFGDIITAFGKGWLQLQIATFNALNDLTDQLIQGFLNLDWGSIAASVGEGILQLASTIEAGIRGLVGGIDFGGLFGSLLGFVADFIRTIIEDFHAMQVLESLPQRIFSTMVSLAVGVLSGFAGQAANIAGNVVSGIVGALSGLPGRVGGIISNLASNALGILRGLIGSAGAAAASIASRIISALASLPGRVGSTIANVGSVIVGKLHSFATSAFGAALNLGASIVQGIISGISGLAGEVRDAVGSLVDGAIAWGKSKLHINSPSLVFANEIGAPISEGIAHGILRSAGLVNAALGSVITPPSLSGASGGVAGRLTIPASATVGAAPTTIVHVHFDDPALKGLINVQIDNADQALANQIAAGTL